MKGKFFTERILIVYFLKNHYSFSRIGICVSKKVGKAVQRNLIKRRLREAIRTLTFPHSGYDIILLARKSIVTADYWEIYNILQKVLNKIHFYEKSSD